LKPVSPSKTAALPPLVKRDPQFVRCETWSVFANEAGNAKAEEFPDLLHPNAAGYKKWAEAFRPVLGSLKLVGP
jgi:lysophospholipase L1-like esterase